MRPTKALLVLAVIVAAPGCWLMSGHGVATAFTTSTTGSITITTAESQPPTPPDTPPGPPPTGPPSPTDPPTTPPAPGTLSSADDCKNGGWTRSTNPTFKNQGDCVSHFKPGSAEQQAPNSPLAAAAVAG